MMWNSLNNDFYLFWDDKISHFYLLLCNFWWSCPVWNFRRCTWTKETPCCLQRNLFITSQWRMTPVYKFYIFSRHPTWRKWILMIKANDTSTETFCLIAFVSNDGFVHGPAQVTLLYKYGITHFFSLRIKWSKLMLPNNIAIKVFHCSILDQNNRMLRMWLSVLILKLRKEQNHRDVLLFYFFTCYVRF